MKLLDLAVDRPVAMPVAGVLDLPSVGAAGWRCFSKRAVPGFDVLKTVKMLAGLEDRYGVVIQRGAPTGRPLATGGGSNQ